MFGPYRRVLALPGALAFSMSGLFARLPISMVSLGIVLLVSYRTGSYSLAGAVSASYLIANAAFAVVQGRLTDRLGQSLVLPVGAVVFSTSTALMMWAVEAGWPTPVPQLLAFVAGAGLPQIGSCVRARWSYVARDDRELQTGFAFEAVVDEAVFILGPTVVTFLATGVHPLAGLATAVVAGLGGSLALAAQRRTEPPVQRGPHRHGPRPAMGWLLLGPLVAASAALGILFGGVEVATVAFAEELGARAMAGVLLAVFSLGSLLSALAYGTIHWRSTNATRFRWGITALALALTPLPLLDGFAVTGVTLFVAGFAISPTLIASVTWIEQTVPSSRLTEGISIWTTALAAGVAPGAALAGVVIDRSGASASYWVVVGAGLGGALIAWATACLTGRSAGAGARTAYERRGGDAGD
jgi:MFS family permease